MTFVAVSTWILGIACGFGSAIWIFVAVWHFRHNSKIVGVGYTLLFFAYLASTVIIAGRALGYFQELPRGTSLILLAPILAIPPAIQWLAWLRARALVRDALEKAREAHGG